MISDEHDYFGTDEQKSALRRGRAMYEVVKNDPRFAYYGRGVGIASPDLGSLAELKALARLQGATNYSTVPNGAVESLSADAQDLGLNVICRARWQGAAGAIETAQAVLAKTPMPPDLSLIWITDDTPPDTQRAFGEAAVSCGVLPPSMATLTGRLKPGLAAAAQDSAGRVVSCAASASIYHPEHADGRRECWWGMLATRNERRGERLSLILGAAVLLEMHKRHGFSAFFTGVEPGNKASEDVCRHVGFTLSDTSTLSVIDPTLIPAGRLTK